ncbi:MAG TPA: cytochrome c biogenesis protein CcsA [Polyangia bacterium]|nr:cytochrome c biogenesis protein CcsA [Polyangia bacterium]
MALLIPVLLLYGLSCALYLAFLVAPRDGLARLARVALVLGLLAHTADIGVRCVHGLHPVATAQEAVSFAAWLLVGAYLVISLRYRSVVVGGFVAPVALVGMVLARLSPSAPAAVPPGGLSTIGRIHITLSMIGVAMFALAAAVAVIYLVSESQLKAKKIGILQQRGLPLATLDALGHRCITLGFPVFTIAIVTGAVWVAQLHVAGAALRPEYSISMMTWLAFGALLLARAAAGWQGRRAAWLTLAGFGGALAVVLIYLMRSVAG